MTVSATPTHNPLPLRAADFNNLAEALDYAAKGVTGANFYGSRAQLVDSITYTQLALDAKNIARHLVSMDFKHGDRIVIVAETHANFLRGFFACQYAGLIPVPVPVPMQLGSRAAYVRKTRDLLISVHATAVFTPESIQPLVNEACQDIDMKFVGDIKHLNEQIADENITLYSPKPEDTAYIQFTSGSTRFPRGVVIEQKAVLSNLSKIIKDGIHVDRNDRAISWLPFYHDMGLVGLVLSPIVSQTSIDYLDTRDFAMRPRRWLEIMSANKSTITLSPPFGYELVERRLRERKTLEYDLSHWRVAGVGADTIRPEPLERFANVLAGCGFKKSSFLACYGMAECSLAICLGDVDCEIAIEVVDGDKLSMEKVAEPINEHEFMGHVAKFVDCGLPVSGHAVEIRDNEGNVLPEKSVGVIHANGPSIMSHYFDNCEETENALCDGWLNTGDLGFLSNGHIFITGREKDLIIINGRNIWPQDLEHIAEMQPEIRTGDVLAFSAPGFENETTIVVVMQCREKDEKIRNDLVHRVETAIINEIGVKCFIKLVPPHTLPRTSSGKLSRSTARREYMEQNGISETYLNDQSESNTSVSSAS